MRSGLIIPAILRLNFQGGKTDGSLSHPFDAEFYPDPWGDKLFLLLPNAHT
jgi:hypothetical protein